MDENVEHQADEIPFNRSTVVAISGGGTAAFITLTFFLGLQLVFRDLSSYQLLAAMQNSATTLCFAGITAAATIMPLMLTIFSFAKNSKRAFSQSFFERIKWIAMFCVIAFFSGLLTLTVLSSPVREVGDVGPLWFSAVYYAVVAGLGIMVGTSGTIIIMLYYAILHIIDSLNPYQLRKEEQEIAEKGGDRS